MPEPERQTERHTERTPAAAFTVSILASIGLAIVYWQGGQPQAEGILLALTLGGIGVGMVLWAKRFLPQGPFTEPRGRLESSEDELAAFAADFGEGADVIARRRVLSRLLVGAFAALGVAALFPIRSLGPRPGRGLKTTPFRAGVRLVNEENEPLQPDELPVDAVVTVWPEGHVNAADAPTLLINLRPTADSDPANTGFVAYSKLCTHMGCPVGLFQAELGLLLCPCHQSTFDVYRECKPVFGPATRPLPRLPIGVDDEGFFEALGDFDGPVGPGFWDRGR